MHRALLLVSLLVPSMLAAPAHKGKPTYYYATEVGTVLEYELIVGGVGAPMSETFIETITAVDAKDGGLHITSKRSTGGIDNSSKVLVTAAGVTTIELSGKTLTNNQLMLKLPAKADETWESTLNNPAGGMLKHKTIIEEEVDVPAGKFKAIRVEVSYPLNNAGAMEYSQTFWFAPNVGLVKMQLHGNKAGLTSEQVLKSIKTPKK